MELNKVTIIGGGVLGAQIGLMCAYVGLSGCAPKSLWNEPNPNSNGILN